MMRRYILWIIFLITVLAIGFFANQKPKTASSRAATTDRFAEQDAISDKLVAELNATDPTVAMNDLAKLIDQNPKVETFCHPIVHALGHAAYKKYGSIDGALKYQDDICGAGYLHGVVEERFIHVKDVYAEMQTVCAGSSGRCYHAVGHGLMYFTNDNLPQSLTYCDRYPTSDERVNCYDGIFHENFASNQRDHVSTYVDPQNPLYPCKIEKDAYKSSCYFYAPRYYIMLHPDDYEGLFVLCSASAEPNGRNDCARGIGSIIMKFNIPYPKTAEKICELGDQYGLTVSCIQGLTSYYIVHYTPAKKYDLCKVLEPKHQYICNGFSSAVNVLGVHTQLSQ